MAPISSLDDPEDSSLDSDEELYVKNRLWNEKRIKAYYAMLCAKGLVGQDWIGLTRLINDSQKKGRYLRPLRPIQVAHRSCFLESISKLFPKKFSLERISPCLISPKNENEANIDNEHSEKEILDYSDEKKKDWELSHENQVMKTSDPVFDEHVTTDGLQIFRKKQRKQPPRCSVATCEELDLEISFSERACQWEEYCVREIESRRVIKKGNVWNGTHSIFNTDRMGQIIRERLGSPDSMMTIDAWRELSCHMIDWTRRLVHDIISIEIAARDQHRHSFRQFVLVENVYLAAELNGIPIFSQKTESPQICQSYSEPTIIDTDDQPSSEESDFSLQSFIVPELLDDDLPINNNRKALEASSLQNMQSFTFEAHKPSVKNKIVGEPTSADPSKALRINQNLSTTETIRDGESFRDFNLNSNLKYLFSFAEHPPSDLPNFTPSTITANGVECQSMIRNPLDLGIFRRKTKRNVRVNASLDVENTRPRRKYNKISISKSTLHDPSPETNV